MTGGSEIKTGSYVFNLIVSIILVNKLKLTIRNGSFCPKQNISTGNIFIATSDAGTVTLINKAFMVLSTGRTVADGIYQIANVQNKGYVLSACRQSAELD